MKRAARLTSALLARKGFAMPAATSAYLDQMAVRGPDFHGDPVAPQAELPMPELPQPQLVSTPSAAEPVSVDNKHFKELEKKLERTFAAPHPEMRVGGFGRRRVPAGETGRRVAMTLRLDSERHLKLRVLSAHAHQSCQQILTAALDNYLSEHCEDHGIKSCHCLQQKVGNA